MLERVHPEPRFRVHCLGGLEIVEVASGATLTPASRKARALVGYLAITAKPASRERLATLLWGDRGDEQARASLRQTLYELRALTTKHGLFRTERDSIAILDDVGTDIAAIMAAAHTIDLDALVTALGAWQGDLLEDLVSTDATFDAWLAPERVRVHETLIEVSLEAVKAGMARGEIEPARKAIQLLQLRDGTNERVLRLGLALDHLAGDSGALHHRYDRFRELLKSDLDAAPSAETQRLFKSLTATPSNAPPAFDGTLLDRESPLEDRPTPAGTHGTIAPTPGRRRRAMPWSIVAFAIVLLSAAAMWTIWNPPKTITPSREILVAVLPFQNFGADTTAKYFSEGISAEIADALLRLTQIPVAAPSSSLRFSNRTAARPANVLGATHLLSGFVQRDGERVRVLAQLTEARSGRVIWSRSYQRMIADMPALLEDIAAQIAEALDMRLSEKAIEEAKRVNPEAYDHYLKGRDLFLRRDDWETATAELETSVRLAPSFSKSWSTLAAERSLFASYGFESDNKALAVSMENAALGAAGRALALDPNDAEALGVEAGLTPRGQLAKIGRLFERAVRSEPNDAQLLNWYSSFLSDVGRNDDALYALTQAYGLDRVTPSVAFNLATGLLEVGQFAKAAEILSLSRDYSFRDPLVFSLRVDSFLYQRDWAGLSNFLHKLPDYLSPQEVAYYRLCEETAARLEARASEDYAGLRTQWRNEKTVDIRQPVRFLLALGDPDGALTMIESVAAAHSGEPLLSSENWGEIFAQDLAALRHDPRVPALFARWGLFQYWRATNNWPDFCGQPDAPFDCKREALKFPADPQLNR